MFIKRLVCHILVQVVYLSFQDWNDRRQQQALEDSELEELAKVRGQINADTMPSSRDNNHSKSSCLRQPCAYSLVEASLLTRMTREVPVPCR